MVTVTTILLVSSVVLAPVLGDAPPVYGGAQGRGGGGQDPLGDLGDTIPGVPGEDYPLLGSVPDTSFQCSGQVEGGYYADPEGECQVFHICGGGGEGSLIKYSFLCPNGTLFIL